MSADLYIHVLENVTERDIAEFFRNTYGSKYFSPLAISSDTTYQRISKTPSVWIGEVSWLKAGLTGDSNYIPDPVGEIHQLIGEDLPVLNDELAHKILSALSLDNFTEYRVANPGNVKTFLELHAGKPLFVVSW